MKTIKQRLLILNIKWKTMRLLKAFQKKIKKNLEMQEIFFGLMKKYNSNLMNYY